MHHHPMCIRRAIAIHYLVTVMVNLETFPAVVVFSTARVPTRMPFRTGASPLPGRRRRGKTEWWREGRGVANWNSFSPVSGLPSVWETCGDSRICSTKAGEVSRIKTFLPVWHPPVERLNQQVRSWRSLGTVFFITKSSLTINFLIFSFSYHVLVGYKAQLLSKSGANAMTQLWRHTDNPRLVVRCCCWRVWLT